MIIYVLLPIPIYNTQPTSPTGLRPGPLYLSAALPPRLCATPTRGGAAGIVAAAPEECASCGTQNVPGSNFCMKCTLDLGGFFSSQNLHRWVIFLRDIIFNFYFQCTWDYLGKMDAIWRLFCQMGWNHHLANVQMRTLKVQKIGPRAESLVINGGVKWWNGTTL